MTVSQLYTWTRMKLCYLSSLSLFLFCVLTNAVNIFQDIPILREFRGQTLELSVPEGETTDR